MLKHVFTYLAAAAAVTAVACSDDDNFGPLPSNDNDNGTATIQQPLTYTFESRFEEGVSSVAYTGQTKRHLLIEGLNAYIGNVTDTTFTSTDTDDVVDALVFFYDFINGGADGDTDIDFSTGTVPPLQTKWGDLGGLSSLKEKFPEFDAGFDGTVVGYGDGTFTPEGALLDMFENLAELIVERVKGNLPTDPDGADIALTFVSTSGIDYQQLIEKYLGGAVPLSQGADDYLDDDIEGKGLLSDNDSPSGDAAYTALEHVWDEGFGYFGAARNYDEYSDDEIAKAGGRDDWQGAQDTDGDGSIDLRSEFNFGASVNAAKRDRGSAQSAPTDFTQTAFDAFLAGRTLIVNAGADLTPAQLIELQGYRDAAVGGWERALAATAVHYVNDVLQDMSNFETDDYDFLGHAKHWSELKGFALALQFNVNHSPMTPAQLTELHGYIGNQPVLPTATSDEQNDYKNDLNAAKTLLGQVYQFDSANLGDADGNNGW